MWTFLAFAFLVGVVGCLAFPTVVKVVLMPYALWKKRNESTQWQVAFALWVAVSFIILLMIFFIWLSNLPDPS
jgi:hypothetical protein